jgi:hypothetical protein
MWYPLDTLLYSGRPHGLEGKHLRALRSANVLIRPRRASPLPCRRARRRVATKYPPGLSPPAPHPVAPVDRLE